MAGRKEDGRGKDPYAVRRDHKDRVFRDLFGSERGRRDAMELYNALGGGPATDPSELQVVSVDNALYMGWRDDVSFLVGDDLVLWEHQSTHNPNMPLRGLGYFAQLYGKLVAQQGLDVYGPAPLRLPTPRYVVFYAGTQARPEREELALSDLFASGPGDVEVRATVLNVNKGCNERIMEACRALRGYSTLLDEIRQGVAAGVPIGQAVEAAVRRCIDGGVLAGYLQERRAEVCAMLIDEYEDARQMELLYTSVERNWQRWRDEGIEQGRLSALSGLVAKNLITASDAASELGMSEEAFLSAAKGA